jgi:hypothetical protein
LYRNKQEQKRIKRTPPPLQATKLSHGLLVVRPISIQVTLRLNRDFGVSQIVIQAQKPEVMKKENQHGDERNAN